MPIGFSDDYNTDQPLGGSPVAGDAVDRLGRSGDERLTDDYSNECPNCGSSTVLQLGTNSRECLNCSSMWGTNPTQPPKEKPSLSGSIALPVGAREGVKDSSIRARKVDNEIFELMYGANKTTHSMGNIENALGFQIRASGLSKHHMIREIAQWLQSASPGEEFAWDLNTKSRLSTKEGQFKFIESEQPSEGDVVVGFSRTGWVRSVSGKDICVQYIVDNTGAQTDDVVFYNRDKLKIDRILECWRIS